jgi:hypothetical protein
MTAAFGERDWGRIEQAGFREFVSNAVASVSHSKRHRVREKRREQFSEAFRNFRDVMESDKPPQNKDEAIRQVVGLIGRLLSIIFPQYALLISIISFLWDVSTGNDVTISGVAMGSAEGRT